MKCTAAARGPCPGEIQECWKRRWQEVALDAKELDEIAFKISGVISENYSGGQNAPWSSHICKEMWGEKHAIYCEPLF